MNKAIFLILLVCGSAIIPLSAQSSLEYYYSNGGRDSSHVYRNGMYYTYNEMLDNQRESLQPQKRFFEREIIERFEIRGKMLYIYQYAKQLYLNENYTESIEQCNKILSYEKGSLAAYDLIFWNNMAQKNYEFCYGLVKLLYEGNSESEYYAALYIILSGMTNQPKLDRLVSRIFKSKISTTLLMKELDNQFFYIFLNFGIENKYIANLLIRHSEDMLLLSSLELPLYCGECEVEFIVEDPNIFILHGKETEMLIKMNKATQLLQSLSIITSREEYNLIENSLNNNSGFVKSSIVDIPCIVFRQKQFARLDSSIGQSYRSSNYSGITLSKEGLTCSNYTSTYRVDIHEQN